MKPDYRFLLQSIFLKSNHSQKERAFYLFLAKFQHSLQLLETKQTKRRPMPVQQDARGVVDGIAVMFLVSIRICGVTNACKVYNLVALFADIRGFCRKKPLRKHSDYTPRDSGHTVYFLRLGSQIITTGSLKPLQKSLIGKQNHGRSDTCIRHFVVDSMICRI